MRAGMRLRSATCECEVVVVSAPSKEVPIECGGLPMMTPDSTQERDVSRLDPELSHGTQLGKRYVDPETGAELLCTKAGRGTLVIDGRPLTIKDAKPLPTSD